MLTSPYLYRRLARKQTPCPITGLPALYTHPLSNIPFANIQAYRTIEDILKHRYVWSEGMGAYIGDEERVEGATGVPTGWEGAVSGRGVTTGGATAIDEKGVGQI